MEVQRRVEGVEDKCGNWGGGVGQRRGRSREETAGSQRDEEEEE